MKKTVIAVATAAALSIAAVPVAYAQEPGDSSTQPSQPQSRAQADLAATAAEGEYTDRDVARLLLVGEGPMATPELTNLLGFDENRPKADPADLEKILDLYLATVPDFNETVSVPFQSGDPIRVDAALRNLSTTFNEFLTTQSVSPQEPGDPSISARGWTYMGAYVVIYANAVGVANVLGYTNVAGATLAVATLAFLTWYLPGYESTSGIDRDARVAQLADAVSK